MSHTPSKKMLALNAVLLTVLLVSLPLQVKAVQFDFWDALNEWSGCHNGWFDCIGGCPPYPDPNRPSCVYACSAAASACAVAVYWPEPQMDECSNARAKHNECLVELSVCESTEIEDCTTPYWDCRTASGIDACE
jgi:hypothetical protein